ncbi:MAG: glutamine-hydrolyzing GMP synthase [Synergistaceae bacterium]|nr:glutamine-hydrolyzing GMP synthase [Synergistaceae bacterium]
MLADNENIIIINCGSQFTQLIARRLREMKVHSVIFNWDADIGKIKSCSPKGIIISGGPDSVNDPDAITIAPEIISLGCPVMGICYGMQLLAKMTGGTVISGHVREYGVTEIHKAGGDSVILSENIPDTGRVLMSHGDNVAELPPGFRATSLTDTGIIASIEDTSRNFYGLQFHPEVVSTESGNYILRNFAFTVCKCHGDWNLSNWVDSTIAAIRETVGDSKVVCGLSGGVDSSVAATLVHKAIGDNLQCVFVNHGLMRLNEPESVMKEYENIGLNVKYVDASEIFLRELDGVTDPEKKRKIIGRLFIEVFDGEAKKIDGAEWLLQGTIYPDVIESGTKKGSALIKSHHNVGGLPEKMNLKLLEPLRDLFKDEVRRLGKIIGMPDEIISRQPFPGPGLAVRCLGAVTKERLDTLRKADAIFREELKKAGLYSGIWQAFCVLLPVKSVGVMGDSRTYNEAVVLRAIHSQDAMTAEWSRIDYDVVDRVSKRICNEVPGINRVVMDVTSKPPATIEWE